MGLWVPGFYPHVTSPRTRWSDAASYGKEGFCVFNKTEEVHPVEEAKRRVLRRPGAGDDVRDDAGTSHPPARRLPGSRDDASVPVAGSSVAKPQ